MGDWHPRDDWSDVALGGTHMAPVDDVFVHHTGGDGPAAFDGAYLRSIEHYEMSRPGDPLDAIAYHRIIFANGDRAEGRGPDIMGAATYTWNDRSIAICAVGNFQNYDPTPECVDAIVFEITWMIENGFIRPAPRIRGHRDAPNNSTACPGEGLEAHVDDIARRVGGVVPGGATPAPAPGAPGPGGPALLVQGSVGPNVATWQNLLNAFAGEALDVDGVFGALTDGATRRFQAAHGLVVDGIVGPATNGAMADLIGFLGSLPGAPAPPAPPTWVPAWPGVYLVNPTAGNGTAQWQAQMAARGWSIDVDDQYGRQSEGVCRSFQIDKGLDVDGVVGPVTWDAAWTAPIT